MAIRGECDIDLERINEHTVSNKDNLNYSSLKLMQLQNVEKNCVAGRSLLLADYIAGLLKFFIDFLSWFILKLFFYNISMETCSIVFARQEVFPTPVLDPSFSTEP
jgi:hypothetical protein